MKTLCYNSLCKKILCIICSAIIVFSTSISVLADNSIVDFNNDSSIDILDLVIMKQKIAAGASSESKSYTDLIKSYSDKVFYPEDLVSLIDVLLGKSAQFIKAEGDSIGDDF